MSGVGKSYGGLMLVGAIRDVSVDAIRVGGLCCLLMEAVQGSVSAELAFVPIPTSRFETAKRFRGRNIWH